MGHVFSYKDCFSTFCPSDGLFSEREVSAVRQERVFQSRVVSCQPLVRLGGTRRMPGGRTPVLAVPREEAVRDSSPFRRAYFISKGKVGAMCGGSYYRLTYFYVRYVSRFGLLK